MLLRFALRKASTLPRIRVPAGKRTTPSLSTRFHWPQQLLPGRATFVLSVGSSFTAICVTALARGPELSSLVVNDCCCVQKEEDAKRRNTGLMRLINSLRERSLRKDAEVSFQYFRYQTFKQNHECRDCRVCGGYPSGLCRRLTRPAGLESKGGTVNKTSVSRRGFLSSTAIGAGFTLAFSPDLISQNTAGKAPGLDLSMVEAFVRAGHVDLDRTKQLLAQEPGLLNAAWDWGGGDWETALGGAGHMGNRDIALFLISKGARTDIFHAAMLGRLDIVKPMLAAYPDLAASKGPHGITLLMHAKAGGSEALAVVRFLESLTQSAS
jgi:hypothetical protein